MIHNGFFLDDTQPPQQQFDRFFFLRKKIIEREIESGRNYEDVVSCEYTNRRAPPARVEETDGTNVRARRIQGGAQPTNPDLIDDGKQRCILPAHDTQSRARLNNRRTALSRTQRAAGSKVPDP